MKQKDHALKCHIKLAEYVTLIFQSDNWLILNLERLIYLYHGWDEKYALSKAVFVIQILVNQLLIDCLENEENINF